MAEGSSSEWTVIAQFQVHKAKGESVESDKEEGTCIRYTYTLSLSSSGSDSELLVTLRSVTYYLYPWSKLYRSIWTPSEIFGPLTC